jgi:hypothetical protein
MIDGVHMRDDYFRKKIHSNIDMHLVSIFIHI